MSLTKPMKPPSADEVTRPPSPTGWRGTAVGVGVVVAFALVSAASTPRGPVTAIQAIVSLFAALTVGLVVGAVTGSRWFMLGAPLLYVAVFELGRLGAVGPTVDQIRLSSTYGLIAFAVGRIAHGLIVLAPMALGAGIGWGVAGRVTDGATWGRLGWSVVSVIGVGVVALVVSLARPASTAPILGPDGESPAGRVAELVSVEIGGHDQVIMIRGRSVENPVLLYLAGGPGGTDLGAMRRDTSLEGQFVVATWDQRGAGKSYAALEPTETLTLEQMVADTIEVTEYLRDRFDEREIYLVGNSWGSTLGVLAVQRRPDLFAAYVGVGQMVSQQETDVMFWQDALAWAEETGDAALAETLLTNGPPPYDDLPAYESAVGTEHLWNDYPGLDLGNEMPAILFVPEYDLMDRVNAFRGFLDSFSVLYPQLQDLDFRRDVRSLHVPVYLVTGEHEARGRAVLANEWFDMLDAPSKESVVFAGAGHRALFDRPAEFAGLMRQIVEQHETSG